MLFSWFSQVKYGRVACNIGLGFWKYSPIVILKSFSSYNKINLTAMYDCFCVDDVSIEQQVTVQQTGVGLAWSYYYGYLKIVLPSELIWLFNTIEKIWI